jgi:hypothetical protein
VVPDDPAPRFDEVLEHLLAGGLLITVWKT